MSICDAIHCLARKLRDGIYRVHKISWANEMTCLQNLGGRGNCERDDDNESGDVLILVPVNNSKPSYSRSVDGERQQNPVNKTRKMLTKRRREGWFQALCVQAPFGGGKTAINTYATTNGCQRFLCAPLLCG